MLIGILVGMLIGGLCLCIPDYIARPLQLCNPDLHRFIIPNHYGESRVCRHSNPEFQRVGLQVAVKAPPQTLVF